MEGVVAALEAQGVMERAEAVCKAAERAAAGRQVWCAVAAMAPAGLVSAAAEAPVALAEG